MYQHILIALDGSQTSEECLTHGLQLAELAGCAVSALTVTVPFSVSSFRETTAGTPSDPDEYDAYWQEIAETILAAARSEAASLSIDLNTLHVSEISPATAIIDTAERLGCDLIVMGSHGRKGPERSILGSQTTHVLSMCKIPVVVVR